MPGSPPSAGSFVPAGACVTSVENFRSIVYSSPSIVFSGFGEKMRPATLSRVFVVRSAVIRLPVISMYCVIVAEYVAFMLTSLSGRTHSST